MFSPNTRNRTWDLKSHIQKQTYNIQTRNRVIRLSSVSPQMCPFISRSFHLAESINIKKKIKHKTKSNIKSWRLILPPRAKHLSPCQGWSESLTGSTVSAGVFRHLCVSLACGSSSIEKQQESDSKHSHESCTERRFHPCYTLKHKYKWYNQAQNWMNKWRTKIQMNSHRHWTCKQPFNSIYCKRLAAWAPLYTDRGRSRPRPDLWPTQSVGRPCRTHRGCEPA